MLRLRTKSVCGTSDITPKLRDATKQAQQQTHSPETTAWPFGSGQGPAGSPDFSCPVHATHSCGWLYCKHASSRPASSRRIVSWLLRLNQAFGATTDHTRCWRSSTWAVLAKLDLLHVAIDFRLQVQLLGATTAASSVNQPREFDCRCAAPPNSVPSCLSSGLNVTGPLCVAGVGERES